VIDDTQLNNVVFFSHQHRRKRLENAQDFFSFCQDQEQVVENYITGTWTILQQMPA